MSKMNFRSGKLNQLWPVVRSTIEYNWKRISLHDLEYVRGDLRGLKGRLRRRYGTANDKIKRAYRGFMADTESRIRSWVEVSRPPHNIPVRSISWEHRLLERNPDSVDRDMDGSKSEVIVQRPLQKSGSI